MNNYRPESQQRNESMIAFVCFVAIAAIVGVMVLTTEPGPATVRVRGVIEKVVNCGK